jgi:hypothetical protein
VEELIALLFQIVIELIVQLVIYLPFDWGLSTVWSRAETTDGNINGCGYFFLFMIMGGVLGGLSLLIEPRLLLPYAWMRITNLFVTPILAGALSWLFAKWRRQKQSGIVASEHFGSAFLFGLAFSLVRFTFGTR